MNDLIQYLEEKVNNDDWAIMAEHAEMPATDLKTAIFEEISKLESLESLDFENQSLKEEDLLMDNRGCVEKRFELSLLGVVAFGGRIKLCGSEISDFKAEIEVYIKVLGKVLWKHTFKIDLAHLEYYESFNLKILKGHVGCGAKISSDKICFSFSARICVDFFGWKCAGIDPRFCLPLPF